MEISQTDINLILQGEGIESLLAIGTPEDEYRSEAAEIARSLQSSTQRR